MTEITNSSRIFTDEEKKLLAAYYKKRKIKIFSFLLLAILLCIGIFLFFNKEETLLILTTDKTVIVKQSKIEKFDAKKYIKYAKKNNTVIKIPDIKDTKNKAGEYKFQYSVYDKKTKKSQKEYLNIEIKDDIKPILKLTDKEINVTQNQKIDLLSFVLECTDNNDEDLKNKIKYNSISTENIGEFKVTYIVKDKSKNKTSKSITIKVSAPEPAENNEEVTNQKNNSEQNQNTVQQEQQSNSNTNTQKKDETINNKSHPELNGKQFLFTEGYDMSNVMSVCASELSRNNTSGSCVPIYENGVIIGAKIVIN